MQKGEGLLQRRPGPALPCPGQHLKILLQQNSLKN